MIKFVMRSGVLDVQGFQKCNLAASPETLIVKNPERNSHDLVIPRIYYSMTLASHDTLWLCVGGGGGGGDSLLLRLIVTPTRC